MRYNDPEKIQAEVEEKSKQRAKKKGVKMKISGASVKKLQRIIINKSK